MTIRELYKWAAHIGLVSKPDANALTRARRAHKRYTAEPGDYKPGDNMLAALAVAFADTGQRPGYLPEVQRKAVEIVKLFDVEKPEFI